MTCLDSQAVGNSRRSWTWLVCDRDGTPQQRLASLADAVHWAMSRFAATTVATRVEIAANDYWYLLVDKTDPTHVQTQVRITRSDRAAALGWDLGRD